jgi:hypothetical protein
MSGGAAYRRAVAARHAKDFPSIIDRVERGDLHLSALCLLDNYLTADNHEELLNDASGRTIEGLRQLLATRFPRPDVPSRFVTVSDELAPTAAIAQPSAVTVSNRARHVVEPLSPGRYRVEFTASTALRDKIVRALELMSHSNPSGDFAVMFDRALDLLVAKLERERFGKSSRPRQGEEPATMKPTTPSETKTRYVTAKVRREVHERDGEQCTFVGTNGRRCPSRVFIQRDHVEAWAEDGGNDAANLRHLCWAHNKLYAERKFGKKYIEEKIKQRRKKAPKPSAPDPDAHCP